MMLKVFVFILTANLVEPYMGHGRAVTANSAQRRFLAKVSTGLFTIACPDGQSFDKFVNGEFTCKSGPGDNFHCEDREFNWAAAECPNFGFVSAITSDSQKSIVRCCSYPDIKYKTEDCLVSVDVAGEDYSVPDGTYINGWRSYDGGLTYENKVCRYENSPAPKRNRKRYRKYNQQYEKSPAPKRNRKRYRKYNHQ